MSRAPNILFVILDAARRDTFSPYGAAASATPTIDGLADRGIALADAYSTAPWTMPSHTAMFTGRLAEEFGLDQAPGGDLLAVRSIFEAMSDRLLASVLTRAGYRTHGFSANLWVSAHSGMATGFDTFESVVSRRGERGAGLLAESRLASRRAWLAEGLRARSDGGAAAIGERLRGAIARAEDDVPQFWFVNLIEPHSPYLPPRPFNDLSARERMRAAIDCGEFMNFTSICLAGVGALHVPAEALERLRYLHGRAVSYSDAWLGQVLAALASRDMLEDTLVIVTSDHGESFGEDGLISHGFSVAQQLVHVPLVAAGPGADLFGSGVFSLASLPSVIATAAGISDHGFTPATEGIALARYGSIGNPEDTRIRSFADRWSLSEEQVQRLTAGERGATDGELKLVVTDSGRRTLTDLSTGVELDPDDPSGADLVAALGRVGVDPDTTPVPAGAAGTAATDDEVAALERQMRLLGYM